MAEANALGEYLKARRELVRPEEVGIRTGGIRRVAGLRREEVAMLAGISSDYYLRLEQGRDRNPSVQVLEALARVLQLDELATAYLVSLVQARSRKTKRRVREVVPAGIRQLLDVLQQPAFVEGRYLDVLAANPLAVALSPTFAVGGNRMRDFFLDEREHLLYPDWDTSAVGLVAGFRALVGTDTTDPRFVQLVGELSLGSEPFRRLWARHDVQTGTGAPMLMRHPQVGDLHLYREKLALQGTNGQLLVIYHAQAGTDTAGLLSLMGTLIAEQSAVDNPVPDAASPA